jgi:hypothetical protein
MDELIRPGPDRIDAHCAPHGLVICTYDLNGECLTEDELVPGSDIEASAREAAEFLTAILTNEEAVVIVVYDGDTGERWSEDDWRRFGLEPGGPV